MSDCSYTAFAAPQPIRGQINWANGHRPTPLSYARFVNGEERIAESVEIDGVVYAPERLCDVAASYDTSDVFGDNSNAEWYFSFSCGCELYWDEAEPPNYCPSCGARVIGGGDD